MSRSSPSSTRQPADPFVAALARYVEALDRHYPGGPPQLQAELDARAKVSVMPTNPNRKPAA
jgi:hypothetical protein